MTPQQAAERFLTLKRIALVGVSSKPEDFSRSIFKGLVKAGLDVVPVRPGGGEIEGRPTFASLTDVRPPVQGALVMVSPAWAEAVARDAIVAGVKTLWFHRGAGPGSGTPAAVKLAREADLEVIENLCPFMVLPKAGWFHRVHAYFRLRAVNRHPLPQLPASAN